MSDSNPGNIVSVSWGDHLVFGEGDGMLSTPDALEKRMKQWHDNLGATSIHWRQIRSMVDGHFSGEGQSHVAKDAINKTSWDDFDLVPHLAHEHGMKANLYVSLFDEGWPLPSKKEREVSYHNSMHYQHVSWQSEFSASHPEFTVIDQSGKKRQWGILCLAYPQVREYFRKKFLKLLEGYEFDGLFICFRSQSRPADFADQYNFNEPIRTDFLDRYGKDILQEDFDLQAWRDMLGEYLTLFLTELKESLNELNLSLSVGCARGDVLGPPMGNTSLQWRKWIQDDIVDELIINQNSSQCPSMWHQLWQMHRGNGYLQNYLDGYNLPLLEEHLNTYLPYISENPTKLFIARQWVNRSKKQESEILKNPAVSGLVFSSFRFDNPGPISKGNWIA